MSLAGPETDAKYSTGSYFRQGEPGFYKGGSVALEEMTYLGYLECMYALVSIDPQEAANMTTVRKIMAYKLG